MRGEAVHCRNIAAAGAGKTKRVGAWEKIQGGWGIHAVLVLCRALDWTRDRKGVQGRNKPRASKYLPRARNARLLEHGFLLAHTL
jgi:hypothetical protein